MHLLDGSFNVDMKSFRGLKIRVIIGKDMGKQRHTKRKSTLYIIRNIELQTFVLLQKIPLYTGTLSVVKNLQDTSIVNILTLENKPIHTHRYKYRQGLTHTKKYRHKHGKLSYTSKNL